MLRIGNFQSGYPEPDGITNAVHGISEALVRDGHAVVIYGYGHSVQAPVATSTHSPEVVLFPEPSFPFFAPAALRQRLAANLDRLDLLVIHGMFNRPSVAVAHCAAQARIPYIVCPHCPFDPVLLHQHRVRKALYGFLFEKPALRHAVAVQVFCQKHADLLRSYGIETPAIVVPNGLDPADVPLDEPQDQTLLDGDPKLLFLGRLDSYHKGIDLLIRGFARAFHSGRIPASTMLTLVGPETGDGAALRRLAEEQNVTTLVTFAGKAVDPRRWLLLKSCDLFVLTSRYDGFAMAVTEAMMAGKPLLLSTATANATWIQRAGCAWMAEPSAESISAGLIEAIENRAQWREMGSRARQFAGEQLSWQRAAAIAAEQYAQVLAGGTERLNASPAMV